MPGGLTGRRPRLGSIAFINSLPVDWGMLSGAVPVDAEVVARTPAGLNELMLGGELEISPVSSFWYAKHAKGLLLLPDLAIGSESGVRSVLLIAREPMGAMKDGARVAFSGKGRTTPVLLEILCRQRYGFRPEIAQAAAGGDIPPGSDAWLVIGDEALDAAERLRGTDRVVTDLAQEWRQWTGTPIVFAVWAVQEEFWKAAPERALAIYEAVTASRRWGLAHMNGVLEEARRRTGFPESALRDYFSVLRYGLDETMKQGMRLYFEHAARCGLLAGAPELREIPLPAQSRA